MLTITIFAAGLVCLAGVLGLRLGRAQAQVSTAPASVGPTPTTADERGITLQTLIVTAVLVLMAVAAGVVIVAITNNAADDLENTAPAIETECHSWELYDPIQAAQGEVGSNVLAEGSAVGCMPVCFDKGSKLIAELDPDTTFRPSESEKVGTGDAIDIPVPPTSDGATSGALYSSGATQDSTTEVARWEVPDENTTPSVLFDRAREFCYTDKDRNGNPEKSAEWIYLRP